MQHETKMENQSWLKNSHAAWGLVMSLISRFIVVLLFSTLLTWREVVVLEDAYISSQRNHLENVANALISICSTFNKPIFLRNGMREALCSATGFHFTA